MRLVNYVKRVARKALVGGDINTYFFSQSGEDAILKGIFNCKLRNKEAGYYVDVGAYHPTLYSNTYIFYREGWMGINIDARPGFKTMFDKVRSRDRNVEIGIGLEKGIKDYYFFGDGSSINTFSRDEVDKTGKLQGVKKIIPVQIKPLREVLKENIPDNQKIDFLSVDVEGLDIEVLLSNDWEAFKPDIVLVEQKARTVRDVSDSEPFKLLNAKGYEIVAKTIIRDDVSTIFYSCTD